jgi:TolA-binding protein
MPKQKQESVPEAISASLLRVASTLDEQGKVHQALTPYLKLIERYPDSQEAPLATEKVLAIAEVMRQKGQHHMAMAVLDRLEAARSLKRAEDKQSS